MSRSIALGVIGEKFITSIAKSLFKTSDGFRVKHNDFDNYTASIGEGTDIRIFERNRLVMAIECKNWSEQDKPYGTDIAKSEVIERFRNVPCRLKILIITFMALLTSEAKSLIEKAGITIIEVGEVISRHSFKTQIFFVLRSRILELINKPKQATNRVTNSNNNTLDNYLELTHDTVIEKSLRVEPKSKADEKLNEALSGLPKSKISL